MSEKVDLVNHPPHYNQGDLECINVIQTVMSSEAFEGYLHGNVLKYVYRYANKNGLEDLRKSEWYLKKLIEVRMHREIINV